MNNENNNPNQSSELINEIMNNSKKINLLGYSSSYPAKEDIYEQSKEESNINPENISRMKEINENDSGEKNNEKSFRGDMSGNDLDVPGSELDDADEKNGSEDEENNYYSLGGDNHNDLEEDRGD